MKKLIYSIFSLLLFVPAVSVFGAEPEELQSVNLTKNQITQVVKDIRDWFAGIVVAVGVFMLLYAAILFLTAGGNPETLKKAKNALIYGLIGVGVAVIAYGVFGLVNSFLAGR